MLSLFGSWRCVRMLWLAELQVFVFVRGYDSCAVSMFAFACFETFGFWLQNGNFSHGDQLRLRIKSWSRQGRRVVRFTLILALCGGLEFPSMYLLVGIIVIIGIFGSLIIKHLLYRFDPFIIQFGQSRVCIVNWVCFHQDSFSAYGGAISGFFYGYGFLH